MNRFNDEGFIFTSSRAVTVQHIWLFLRVGFADSASTKFATRMSRAFTMPTFHNFSTVKVAATEFVEAIAVTSAGSVTAASAFDKLRRRLVLV